MHVSQRVLVYGSTRLDLYLVYFEISKRSYISEHRKYLILSMWDKFSVTRMGGVL
jgi:hypothetical protein